jgi:hypothetical protein
MREHCPQPALGTTAGHCEPAAKAANGRHVRSVAATQPPVPSHARLDMMDEVRDDQTRRNRSWRRSARVGEDEDRAMTPQGLEASRLDSICCSVVGRWRARPGCRRVFISCYLYTRMLAMAAERDRGNGHLTAKSTEQGDGGGLMARVQLTPKKSAEW